MPDERGSMLYRYVGNRAEGAALTGVAASHIYEEDWKHLTAEQKALIAEDAKRDTPQVFKKVEAESKGATGAQGKAPAKGGSE